MSVQECVRVAYRLNCDVCAKQSDLNLSREKLIEELKLAGWKAEVYYEKNLMKEKWSCVSCSQPVVTTQEELDAVETEGNNKEV